MDEVALPFFNRYDDLRDVLKLWDSLESLEEKNIYFGGPDKYLRVLIISKLCNDNTYDNKVKEYVDLYASLIEKNGAYEAYYENCIKLVEYLKTIKALY